MTTATATKFDYYNYDKILSFAAFWNFIIGGRGLGKTFGAKIKVLTWAIRTSGDDQFIYMRRYKDELRMSRDTFTADIQDKFPDKDFRHQGWAMQMADASTRDQKKNREWITIGYFIPLSVAQSVKSVSFSKVKTIIFDEFIIEKGMTHYLPNEAVAFQNFYSTVDRAQDKTRVLFLANSVTMENPYFTYYNIRPDKIGEISKHHILANGKPYMVVHIVKSEKFAAQVRKTAFGQFIDGTEYADYALDNQFHDAHGNLVKPKTSDAEYYCTIQTKTGTFSVWVDKHTMTYYVQEKLPKRQIHFTLMPERMDEKKKLLTYNDKKLQYMRTAYNSARMFFDGPKARNSFIDVFRR
jgi:hypothetical protein